jgi:hypothetical protein
MNIPAHATQRPVRDFLRLFDKEIDYCVGGLMDYGYSEHQIEEMLNLTKKHLDAVIARNQYKYLEEPINEHS